MDQQHTSLAAPQRRPFTFHPLLGGALALAPLLALAYAVAAEPFRPVQRRRTLVLPRSWPSLSILHMSDLHVRRGAQRLLRAQAALLRGLQPDLCVVTGDLCESPDDVEPT